MSAYTATTDAHNRPIVLDDDGATVGVFVTEAEAKAEAKALNRALQGLYSAWVDASTAGCPRELSEAEGRIRLHKDRLARAWDGRPW